VDPGAEVGPGQPLVAIRSSGGGAEIVVAVPESDAARLTGARAAFQVGDGPWRAARLERLEGMTDPATRTRTAHLRPAGAAAAAGLEAGAFARVRFTPAGTAEQGAATAAYLVPEAALVRRGGLAGVFVVSEGRAHLRWVRAGRSGGGQVEILAGLFPGDEVAVPAAGLADGRRVTGAGAGGAR